MQDWLLNVASDENISCGALRTAIVLSFGFNATTGGCWQTKSTMAKSVRVSVSGIKQGLAELDTLGHILRAQEDVRGRDLRVIYPVLNPEIKLQEPRARRGGVPKGVDPRRRAAENAARTGDDPKAKSVAPTHAEASPTPQPIPEPAPVLNPAREVADSAVTPAPSPPEREERAIKPEARSAVNVFNERHPPGGIPYHSIRQRMDMQGFRGRPGLRLTPDDFRAGSQAWADGQFDSWAEHLTGEGPIHRSPTRTEGQSKPWAKGQPPCIQEKSKIFIPDPIKEDRSRPELVVIGCSHADCRAAARYRCSRTDLAFCVRHRGNSYAAVEIREGQ
ncbi:hypothetical protein R1A27_34485 (plasmid) [Methylobacterium sp. NMS12]|uniref:SPOR domain-containing protein n=1 Tax=Methylobacterium sp. NMS12 TaxID=3079766 RepID=UPI003F880E5A